MIFFKGMQTCWFLKGNSSSGNCSTSSRFSVWRPLETSSWRCQQLCFFPLGGSRRGGHIGPLERTRFSFRLCSLEHSRSGVELQRSQGLSSRLGRSQFCVGVHSQCICALKGWPQTKLKIWVRSTRQSRNSCRVLGMTFDFFTLLRC